MSKRYRVWIEVEEATDEGTAHEEFESLHVPFGSCQIFDTREAALAYATRLYGISRHELTEETTP